MDPGEQPDELKNLTIVEQMIIVKVHPVMIVMQLIGGQYGYRGQVIIFLRIICLVFLGLTQITTNIQK